MGKTVIRLMPVNTMDFVGIENYLESMAKKGFALESFGRFCFFKKGVPQNLKYRLEIMENKDSEPTDEAKEFYNEFGYTYVSSFSNIAHVWCGSENAREIHTDPSIQSESYEKAKKRMKKSLIWSIIVAIALIALNVYNLNNDGVSRMIGSNRNLYSLIFAIIYPFILILSVDDYFKIAKKTKQLQQGQPIKHGGKYKNSIVQIVALFMLIVFVFYGMIIDPFVQIGMREKLSLNEIGERIDYVRLDDIETGVYYENDNYKDTKLSTYVNGCSSKTSIIAPKRYDIWQTGMVNDSRVQAEYNYTQLISEDLAKIYFKEITQKLNLETLDNPNFDKVMFAKEQQLQNIAILNGNKVCHIEYQGSVDLTSNLDMFINMMK